jgi:hypothetical protein
VLALSVESDKVVGTLRQCVVDPGLQCGAFASLFALKLRLRFVAKAASIAKVNVSGYAADGRNVSWRLAKYFHPGGPIAESRQSQSMRTARFCENSQLSPKPQLDSNGRSSGS